MKGSDNDYPSILLTEGTTPASPAASHDRLFVRSSDHLLCLVNSSGAVTAVGGGGGGITRTTLGTTTVGGSFDTRGMKIKKITLASAGLLASINVHMKSDATNRLALASVLYSDSSGNPTNLLHVGTPAITRGDTAALDLVKMNTTARWFAFPVGVWLAAADYWIGIYISESSGTQQMIAYSSGTGSDRTVAGGTENLPQDSSIQAISTGTNDYSIYADILR